MHLSRAFVHYGINSNVADGPIGLRSIIRRDLAKQGKRAVAAIRYNRCHHLLDRGVTRPVYGGLAAPAADGGACGRSIDRWDFRWSEARRHDILALTVKRK